LYLFYLSLVWTSFNWLLGNMAVAAAYTETTANMLSYVK